MMKFSKYEILTITGASISFLIFAIILKLSNISVDSLVNLQNNILKTAIVQTAGMSTTDSLAVLLSQFVGIFISFLFLVLGFVFLSTYGFFIKDSRFKDISLWVGFITGIISFIIFSIIFHSVMSIFLSVAVLISSIYIIPLANTYGKELKKWIFFRVGSHSVSKVLLIINLLIALGIFISVLANQQFYKQSFENEITDIAASMIPQTNNSIIKEEIGKQISASLQKSPIFESYFRWLPVISALGIWVIFEFLRGLIFSNFAGLFSTIMIRLKNKIDKKFKS
jgi:hypothetical protein